MQKLIFFVFLCSSTLAMENDNETKTPQDRPTPEQLAALKKKVDMLESEIKKFNQEIRQVVFDLSKEEREEFRKYK